VLGGVCKATGSASPFLGAEQRKDARDGLTVLQPLPSRLLAMMLRYILVLLRSSCHRLFPLLQQRDDNAEAVDLSLRLKHEGVLLFLGALACRGKRRVEVGALSCGEVQNQRRDSGKEEGARRTVTERTAQLEQVGSRLQRSSVVHRISLPLLLLLGEVERKRHATYCESNSCSAPNRQFL
jgi:hypothetical protein